MQILKNYIIFFLVFLSNMLISRAQWDGGNGHGTTSAFEEKTCDLINIFTATYDDGYGTDSIISECQAAFVYTKGGTGQGFSEDTSYFYCPFTTIFKGSQDDGFSQYYSIGCQIDTLIPNYDVISYIDCVTGDSAMASAIADTSNPEYSATPPFTYTWYKGFSSGTQIRTITRPDYADTLDKLPEGLYTVVITDGASRVDSVNFNIAGCLYRGGQGKGYAFDTVTKQCNYDQMYTGSEGDGYNVDSLANACDNAYSPYTRGSSGQGFAVDTAIHQCQGTSIHKGTTLDGFACEYDILTCEYTYFCVGGQGNGFARDTSGSSCSVLQIYTGSQDDGHDQDSITNTCRNYMTTVGGSGNGFSRDTSQSTCSTVNVYTGSQDDGYDSDSIMNECFAGLFSNGGTGHGFSIDTSVSNCTPDVIVRGNEADGHSQAQDVLDCSHLLPFTKGGTGHGFSIDTASSHCTTTDIFKGSTHDGAEDEVNIACMVDTLVFEVHVNRHLVCTPTNDTLGIATLNILEERPYWGSDGPYIVDWKDVTSLDGFPVTTTSKSIQVDSLDKGEYTVIVTDTITDLLGAQQVIKDSVTFIINGCLYRGGSGDGDASDTALQDCPLINSYAGSTGDGYSDDTIINICDILLYTQGGDGDGFHMDTSLSTCTVTNVYTGTQDDGCSHDTLNNDCSTRTSVFKGGTGNGFSTDTSGTTCVPVSLYRGSTADGAGFIIDTSDCDMPLTYKGGTGAGFSMDTTGTSCPVSSIHKGNRNDGADFMYDGCTPLIYDRAATRDSCIKAGEFTSSGTGEWEQIGLGGDIVIGINDNGNAMDTLEIWFYVNDGAVRQDPNNVLEDYYLDRNFWIVPKHGFQNFTTPVSLRLYFTNTEYVNLRNEDPNVSAVADLQVTKYDGANDDCTLANDAPNNNDTVYGFINDNPTESISHWTYENGYYVEFDVNYFHSEFYINYHDGGPDPNDPMSIDDFDDVCLDTTPMILTQGNPAGGAYSGPGVSGDTFNPAVAGAGTHYITYAYTFPSGRVAYDSSAITVHPLPTVYTVNLTDDGEICEGDTGEGLYLSDSEIETRYNVYRNDTLTAFSRYGDNDSIMMGIVNTAGDYSIIAIDTSTGCDTWMDDTLTLLVHPTPAPDITADNPVCALTTGYYYTAETPGNNYVWTLDSTTLGTVTNIAPDSISIDWNQITTGGSSTTGLEVVETNPGTGCTGSDSIIITIHRKPETGEYYYLPNE